MTFNSKTKATLASLATVFMLSACDSSTDNEQSMTAFSLDFTAMSGVEEVTCDSTHSNLGTDGHYSVGVSDLRFYVSNVALYDQYGEAIEMTLDDGDFQLNHEQGFVGLVDLTSNESGTCAEGEVANSGGTARVNNVLTGMMLDTGVSKVTFDVGVPQAVMKDVISTSSAEAAPSPLNEMYWSWASGYRHFVMNFAINSHSGVEGAGYIHVGSKGCGGEGLLALEDKESCDFVNTAKVELDNFDPAINNVVIDVDALLADLVFSSTGGESVGVSCHSAGPDAQADCGPIFNNLGLSTEDGTATVSANKVFTSN